MNNAVIIKKLKENYELRNIVITEILEYLADSYKKTKNVAYKMAWFEVTKRYSEK